MFDFLKRMYNEGRINKEYLKWQVIKEHITEAEYKTITGEVYVV